MGADVFQGSIFIEAPPEEVFRYFTQAEALATWMGDRALVEPHPDGRFILHFDDRVVEGRYLVVDFPRRVVVTWGRHGSVRLPPGGSTLDVSFAAEDGGTRVTILHDGLPALERDLHAAGWDHYLPRLARAATGDANTPHRVPEHLVEGVD